MMMQPCSDETAFQWIKSGCAPLRGPEDKEVVWQGNTVANLLPQTFDAYAKILHRIDGRYDWIDNPLSQEEIQILQLPSCSQVEGFVRQARREESGTRVRWREICTLLNLPFSAGVTDDWFRQRMEPGCWPRYFWGPPNCSLEPEEFTELIKVASLKEDAESCFARLPYFAFIGADEPPPLLYKGKLLDIPNLSVEHASAEYWWPESRNWCVCSDYDLPFTVVGGPQNFIDQILASDILEAVVVTPHTRIDYKTPIS